MDQSQFTTADQPQPYQQAVKAKAPIFVIIIAWGMLLSGIGSLLVIAPFLLLGGGMSEDSFIYGVIFGFGGIGFVIVSFGIRKMRRWALYSFTALIVLIIGASLYSFATGQAGDLMDFAVVAIQILVLGYFWTISKRFT